MLNVMVPSPSPTALKTLSSLQSHVRDGGIALDMFEADHHCLFSRTEMGPRFVDWEVPDPELSDVEAPHARNRAFATSRARKPGRPS
jgi:hypothetical protein